MKLWSGLLSPFSAKVRMAAGEKGIELELLEIPWSRKTLWGPKPEAFLAVSPRAEVPVLVDGDLAVFDSTVICEYLEETHPENPLMPAEPAGRAVCRMWEDQADFVIANHVTTLIREVFLGGGDEAAIAGAKEGFARYHAALEARLAGQGYLAGAFSVADIGTFLALGFGGTLACPVPGDKPALSAWNERVYERPVVKAEFDAMMAGAAVV